MRVWCEVYDGSEELQGTVYTISQCSVTKALDGAGSINLNVPLTDEDGLSLLTSERRVILYVEHGETTRELGRGVVRQHLLDEDSSRGTISISGPDSLDALTRRNTLLGRIYDFQTVAAIAEDLISLVPGWSVEADIYAGATTQNARFDGASVLKALLRLAEEAGLHLREGSTANSIEIGAFGTSNNIRLAKLQSLTREMYDDDLLIPISSIQVKTDSQGVVNWIIPNGAGEGTAALDLARNQYTSPYTVGSMTGPDGRTLYYLQDTASIAAYGQVEKLVTFKEIAPIANNELAKTRAANALYLAAVDWLQKHKDPLTSYTVRGVKCRTSIRPGDKIWLEYKGVADTADGTLTYIDVNQLVWVMRVTEHVGVGGMTLTLDLATVARQAESTAKRLVEVSEAIHARNVSIQTFPCVLTPVYYDTLGNGGSELIKNAEFRLKIDSNVTDLVKVICQFRTRPLWTPVIAYDLTPLQFNWHMRQGYNYPSDVTFWVNGVDISDDVGGPWNVGGVNAALDEEIDITDYIFNASGGLYQSHDIVVKCGTRTGEVRVTESHPSVVNGEASTGIVEMAFTGLLIAQPIKPG